MCFSFYHTLRYRMGPGSWVQLGGMMMLAHNSRDLEDMGDEIEARKRTYQVAKGDSHWDQQLLLENKAR